MIDFGEDDLNLLQRYHLLNQDGKKEVVEYLRYLLSKQWRSEMHAQVFGNPLIFNLLSQARRMCERDDCSLADIDAKVGQAKYLYYQAVERVNTKFELLLQDAGAEFYVQDWGVGGFSEIADAGSTGSRERVSEQIEEMLHGYRRLAKKGDRRIIVAV
ncbi:MAG: hypothetical protein ACM3QZ_04735 [Solirubrobacterales bacterium]